MTRKIDFKKKFLQLADIIRYSEEHTITDASLMMELEFTPPSWKVWKPKFVEICQTNFFNWKEVSKQSKDKVIKKIAQVEYNKKKKIWVWNEVQA